MRFAIIGCGNIAKKHVHVIQNYLNNAEIASFCDAASERSKEFGDKYGLPSFSSSREMMETINCLREYIFPLLMKRQDGRCADCEEEDNGMDIDHLIYHPLITLKHLQLLCRDCHVKKHPDCPVLPKANRRVPYTA